MSNAEWYEGVKTCLEYYDPAVADSILLVYQVFIDLFFLASEMRIPILL